MQCLADGIRRIAGDDPLWICPSFHDAFEYAADAMSTHVVSTLIARHSGGIINDVDPASIDGLIAHEFHRSAMGTKIGWLALHVPPRGRRALPAHRNVKVFLPVDSLDPLGIFGKSVSALIDGEDSAASILFVLLPPPLMQPGGLRLVAETAHAVILISSLARRKLIVCSLCACCTASRFAAGVSTFMSFNTSMPIAWSTASLF